MTRVLFLCTHNSARSQMAEGMLRAWAGARFEAFSAGTEASEVRPLAIRAMAELGIDISGHASKTVHSFAGQEFDYAITVCDDGRETCPYFPGTGQHLHWSFEDPSAAHGTEDERLAVFRRVRDQIAEHIRAFVRSSRATARRSGVSPVRPPAG
jgi:arsenate reductase (thioredoxin)